MEMDVHGGQEHVPLVADVMSAIQSTASVDCSSKSLS